MIWSLVGRSVRGGLLLCAAGLLSAAGCGEKDGAGPPKAGCPQGYCGQAPICGDPCKDVCGCCPCQDGVEVERDFFTYVCQSGCFALKSGGVGGAGGAGGTAGSGGQDAGTDCAALGCTAPSVCGVCPGECTPPPCNDGEIVDINGTAHTCVGGCYQPL